VVLGLLVVAACTSGDPKAQEEGEGGAVTVLAAASLTGAFEEIALAFESEHPGVDVQLSFDGSARLATAILEGAPADVFAPADAPNMERLVAEGLVAGDPVDFAINVVQIVVPAGNPDGISSLQDLTTPGRRVALCAPAAPCGRYAAIAFALAGLDLPPAAEQENVKGVLTQVQLGEADAGIVYATDVLAAEGVESVDLPEDQWVQTLSPVAVLDDAPNPAAAASFVGFLRGNEARRILTGLGFGIP